MNAKLFKIAGLFLILALILGTLSACGTKAAATQEALSESGEESAKPSNPGGPGEAVNLTGDATAGAQVYVDNCQKCHGDQGKGGIANPGSEDVTIPALNPIDSTMVSSDPKTFATNIDLFIEHGSTPAGTNPAKVMTAFGDEGKLTPQQIADVIAYVISLNK
jgi:mono/diheme cytochrome c family protein